MQYFNLILEHPIFAIILIFLGIMIDKFFLSNKTVDEKSINEIANLKMQVQLESQKSAQLVDIKKEFDLLNNSYSNALQEKTRLEVKAENDSANFQIKEKQIEEYKEQIQQLKSQVEKFQQALSEKEVNLKNFEYNLSTETKTTATLREELELTKSINNELNKEIHHLKEQIAGYSAKEIVLNIRSQKERQEIEQLQKNALTQFENIANKLFQEKTDNFNHLSKNSISQVLDPLKEKLFEFQDLVTKNYQAENAQRTSLSDKIQDLMAQTNRISTEANNLATALKGQNKKQGLWGEMILESILETSGLIKGQNFTTQETLENHSSGKRLRPDVTIYLPNERRIMIDAKVSLNAYEEYCSTEDNKKNDALKKHINSIKTHIEDLSSKNYDEQDNSLDFTMMFIPIEPAYLLLLQKEQTIWDYAYKKRIILISPTNLIACLKLVSDLWAREMQDKNALEIAKRGTLLYEKFVNFTVSLEKIGENIKKANESYEDAIGQLSEGKGNLISQAEKLKELGIKSDKQIPSRIKHNWDVHELPNLDELE